MVIDSRWTCKLTDYGLFLFKEGNEIDVEAGYNEDYGKNNKFPLEIKFFIII